MRSRNLTRPLALLLALAMTLSMAVLAVDEEEEEIASPSPEIESRIETPTQAEEDEEEAPSAPVVKEEPEPVKPVVEEEPEPVKPVAKEESEPVKPAQVEETIQAPDELELTVGDRVDMSTYMTGISGYTFSSSKPSILSASNSGVLQALAAGNCTLTVTAPSGASATVSVIVRKAPEPEVEPDWIIIKDEFSLTVGGSLNLREYMQFSGDASATLSWVSSAPAVATVDSTGHVTAKGEGTAMVTVSSNTGAKATTRIVVDTPDSPDQPTSAQYLRLSSNLMALGPDEIQPLKVTTDVEKSDLIVRSTDETVAYYDLDREEVFANGPGQTTVTVTAPGGLVATCQVTVSVPSAEVKTIKFSTYNLNMTAGATSTITATRSAEFSLVWRSSNEKVVRVATATDGQAVICAESQGYAIIYAYASDDQNIFAACHVDVDQAEKKGAITLTSYAVYPTVGDTVKLVAAAMPADMPISWASSNKSIATVSNKGLITAVSAGTATISAYNTEYGALCTCTVYVSRRTTSGTTQKVYRPYLNKETLSAEVGKEQSKVLTVNDLPAGATVHWFVSSGSAACVDLLPSGSTNNQLTIRPLRNGTVTITASVYDRNGKGIANPTCKVTIAAPAGVVSYTTAPATAVRFRAQDFLDACSLRGSGTLQQVTFTLPASGQGALYVNYPSQGTRNPVRSGVAYYPTGATNNLGDIYFVPSGNIYNGQINIYYTGIDQNGKSFSGTLTVNISIPQTAAAATVNTVTSTIPATGVAYASTQLVQVDGRMVEFQMYALKDEYGWLTNYVKARDVAYEINNTNAHFNVGWDGSAVTLTPHSSYTANGSEMQTPYSGDRPYYRTTSMPKISGASMAMDGIVLTDSSGGGYTYYKLRDLGQRLGFNVTWSTEKNCILVQTDRGYTG